MEPAPKIPTRRRAISLVVAGLVLVIAGVVGWIGIRGLLAKQELHEITPLASEIESSVASGHFAAARSAANELSAHAHQAASLTDDPVWRAAEVLPVAGPNLTAARELAAAARAISDRIVSPLVAVSESVDIETFKPSDGTLALGPLVAATPTVERVQHAYDDVQRSVAAISTKGTLGVVSHAVERVRDAVDRVGPTLTALANSVRIVPGMLGADGPRNILLLAQNPAELRATGGLVGSLILIHADKGAVSLVSHASTADFPALVQPVMALPTATEGLYGTVVGRYVQDVGATPYFPVSAQLASKMWTNRFGGRIDGVIAIDPVTIGYLLEATGPVTIADGRRLEAGNAVPLLLSDVYHDYPDPAAQDAVFASAASAVFAKVVSGAADATALVSALSRAGGERRLLIWSGHPAEQSVLASTTLAGGLPASTSRMAGIGVYFNDATGGKMDYYLKSTVSVASGVCRADGTPASRVTISLTSMAPADAGESLPAYVTGNGIFGVMPGMIRTRVVVYGAEGGLLVGASGGGARGNPSLAATDAGRPVSVSTVDLRPGVTKTVIVDLLNVKQKVADARLTVTPTLGGIVAPNVALTCTAP
ncbi:DUF4012 domain-containing protein [Diaminobutyricibacter tongyongensis]|uniref:DUF4012 domain-containing protein n=1 Tax=Leifsonia tongyongensis TaxID=1268043 RepID=A0A6L9Y0S6_9MICO|nr:DUF4012 domain-containing protein [Diaminobutyricibacter tongyongensis]NEN06894.1 DUF4012 domain-containing protein [Diaminobutyricibacter tongyongensis]